MMLWHCYTYEDETEFTTDVEADGPQDAACLAAERTGQGGTWTVVPGQPYYVTVASTSMFVAEHTEPGPRDTGGHPEAPASDGLAGDHGEGEFGCEHIDRGTLQAAPQPVEFVFNPQVTAGSSVRDADVLMKLAGWTQIDYQTWVARPGTRMPDGVVSGEMPAFLARS